MMDDGIHLPYKGNKLVGITVLEVSTRQPARKQANPSRSFAVQDSWHANTHVPAHRRDR